MGTLLNRLARVEKSAKASLVRDQFDFRHLTEDEWQKHCDEMDTCKSTFINADIVDEQEWTRFIKICRDKPRDQRR
jgi:hypothetical protein